MTEEKPEKSEVAKREEETLRFWQERRIFEKTLAKPSPAGEFVFYEGPPTANGRPGIHHLEARAFKDAIPRYKTMRGYHVRRKGGWDTHGLPVELQVEKELGLKSKKEVEKYGIAAFNRKCEESVWTYVREWEEFTNRLGYWVDLKHPYVTYKAEYIESLWNIFKTVADKGLVYKDYKVVPWCPRCGTALSSHELAQGYEDVKDLAVTVELKVKPVGEKFSRIFGNNPQTTPKLSPDLFFLAWTTTPWTLPGNVALAVNPNISYVEIEKKDMGTGDLIHFVLAKNLVAKIFPNDEYMTVKEMTGQDLVGLEYEPLYPFLEEKNNGKAYQVYPADFVTTEEGTGIVHIAPMYGQDDFELGTKMGLPKHHLVNEDGTFKTEVGFLAGKFVKDEAVAVEIIKDLASRNLLFTKEKYEHSYPHCWRCKTPLIYFARDSWYIRMSQLREDLVRANEKIKWEPARIKEGRFGEWLREVKDWAISRERYWGTPLPIWMCDKCGEKKVVGSIAELAAGKTPRTRFIVMRHGEAESNVRGIVTDDATSTNHLTAKGQAEVLATAEKLKAEKITRIVASPILRTRETAALVAEVLGLSSDQISYDDRLREIDFGDLDGQPVSVYHAEALGRAESLAQVRARALNFLYEQEANDQDGVTLLVTHEAVAGLLEAAVKGEEDYTSFPTGSARPLAFTPLPHNDKFELDLHRPYIDEVKFKCPCGGEMTRVKEVMDVWFDSGAMPFAQDHYPFAVSDKELAYPADFISEAIDQTRGWFYTLHAVGVLLGKGQAYKNVICLGHILDAAGKKMSKSLGNVVNPWDMLDKYGADALRFWMYAVNQPGEAKNFDEKTVDEVVKKVLNLVGNVTSFYQMYAETEVAPSRHSTNVLDRWIVARLDQLIGVVTQSLDEYNLFVAARTIRDFINDLSTWYLRRSRERFKSEAVGESKTAAATLRFVLRELAKIMAPFLPFLAERVYQVVREVADSESVHLATWPIAQMVDQGLLEKMDKIRELVSIGLEKRAAAGLKIRQPLACLTLRESISPEYLFLLQEELNVEEVKFDVTLSEVAILDTTLTPELKEKGELRELIREIQNWRKEQNLEPAALVVVPLPVARRALVEKFAMEIKAVTKASDFSFS